MYYFSSDLHLNHRNIIKYCNRPFDDEKCMDNVLWAEFRKLKSDDTLFLLGDLSLNKLPKIQWFIEGLACTKVLVFGNHDHSCVIKSSLWDAVFKQYTLEHGGRLFHMQHYPWEPKQKEKVAMDRMEDSIFLHGHIHGSNPLNGDQIDVGVDAWDYKPVNIDQILGLNARREQSEHWTL